MIKVVKPFHDVVEPDFKRRTAVPAVAAPPFCILIALAEVFPIACLQSGP